MDTLSLINDHLAITQQSSLPSDELKATVREIAVITENVKRIIILLSYIYVILLFFFNKIYNRKNNVYFIFIINNTFMTWIFQI